MSDPPAASLPRFRAVAAALLLPSVAFLGVGNHVIFTNLVDVDYSTRMAGVLWAGFACCFVIMFTAFSVAHHTRVGRAVARMGVAAAIGLLVWDALGHLLATFLQNFARAAALDAVVIALLLWLTARTPWRLLAQLAATIGVVLFVWEAGVHAVEVGKLRQARPAGGRTVVAGAPAAPTGNPQERPNVYHILLDAFQAEAYQILSARDPSLALKGFTYYPQFASNYYYTNQSKASLLTGRLLGREESVAAWREEGHRGGLWGGITAAGGIFSQYGPYNMHCSPLAVQCTLDGRPQNTSGLRLGERLIIDLWYLQILPPSGRMLAKYGRKAIGVERDTLLLGDAVTQQRAFSLSRKLWPPADAASPPPSAAAAGSAAARYVETRAQRSYWKQRTPNFVRILGEELSRPRHNQYVFWHVMSPHNPYDQEATCGARDPAIDVRPPPPGGYPPEVADAYLAQAECAMRLVRDLVSLLKMLHKFDESLIIVHGDHGMYPPLTPTLLDRYRDTLGAPALQRFQPHPIADGRMARESATRPPPVNQWHQPPHTAETAALRHAALLLVKFPKAATFTVSARPVQMVDLAPTILTHLGLSTVGYPGIPLQHPLLDVPRTLPFFYGEAKGLTWNAGPLHRFVYEQGAWRADEVWLMQP